ncbi:type IV secretory system conjugative DNA transfer family protein [Hyphococcus lacteus]|uniref:Type IV secretory system conjugative DNA transfer family protein n=1 Tax=Hyphococcus lacteus TaxID=3143536 RepID=A0ABV3Z7T7_9PROT
MRKILPLRSVPNIRSLLKTIFASGPSFWFLALHLIPIAGAVALVVLTFTVSLTPKMLQTFALLYMPYLTGQIVYLIASGEWRQFSRWLITRLAVMKDKFSSVTTNVQLAASRIGTSAQDGFFLTMAPPALSSGLKAQKISYQDDRHVTMIAGSRAGKGRDFILPNLAHWQGSVIAYDPSGELVRETAEYREKVLGQKIIVLDPFGVSERQSDCWNPMAEIDFDDDPLAVDKCYLLAESLHHEQSPDPFWMHAPRKMLASVIGYVGTRSIKENCHLSMVRDLLMTSEPKALWLAMSQNDALGGVLKRFGEANEHRHLEELNSTMELARTAMKWLDSPVMTHFASSSTFSMRELKEGKVTLYIVMPAGMGQSYTAWMRALFNAAFDVMQDTSIPKPSRDVLFLMDEFPLLGTMERIKRAAGEAAKFGVKLFICAQDVTQLKEHYGQSWETFIANAGLLIMFANNDLETQNYLSNRLGKEYYKKYSSSKGGSGPHKSASTSTSLELRDVARTDQVGWQVSRQSGDAFFFIPGLKPMRLPRASHDQWKLLQLPETAMSLKSETPVSLNGSAVLAKNRALNPLRNGSAETRS